MHRNPHFGQRHPYEAINTRIICVPFTFSVPGPDKPTEISVCPGSSTVIVGANGGGKTRLAVWMESSLGSKAHRISAHRALTLTSNVPKINERHALLGLRTGSANDQATVRSYRSNKRWHGNEATSLLDDFNFLVQALFADQSNKALITHQKNRKGNHSPADPTKYESLVSIWQQLLPDRQLHISGDDITVTASGLKGSYPASDLSDGERAIFYMIGQTLTADENSLLIFDEPELHVHRSIMAKVWDELEAARKDCAFVLITHDLELAASRVAQKFTICNFHPAPHWTIDKVQDNTGFDEEITTLILGSRRPILFVEGVENSLDQAIYRCCYPDWTVIPRGSCKDVIHSVVTMRNNPEFTRITCSGIVDADHRSTKEIAHLNDHSISVLSVSEIENIILLPSVSRAIAELESYEGAELENILNKLKADIFATLNETNTINAVVMRYSRRRIDRFLKNIDLSTASTVPGLKEEYRRQTEELNVENIAQQAEACISEAIRDDDLTKLLSIYDNKGLMHLAAKHLKKSNRPAFESWLTRALRTNTMPKLIAAIAMCLPQIDPQ